MLVLGMTAALADNSASITITDKDPEGHVSTQYHYYELLKASINGTAVSYYLPSSATTLKGLLDNVTITKSGNTIDVFTFTESADGTRWNVTVNDAIDENDGIALATALNTDQIKAAALANDTFAQTDTGTVTASGLDQGYYLITSTLGTKLVLKTLGQESIQTKNEYHTDEKTASKTNMEVGDTVTYTIKVHIPATYEVGEYVTVHDTLDSHLAFKTNTLAAHLGSTTGTAVTLEDGTPKEGATETFTKKFQITSDMLNNDVYLTYDAELLSTAADDTGYVNEEFSNTSDYETLPKKVRVWTFDFDLDKNFADVTGDNAANFQATFKLEDSTGARISFIIDSTGYVKADSNDTGTTDTLTINGKDNINIRGLEAGTYTLTELTTADGYNLLTDTIAVTITDTSDADCATDETKTPSHTVTYKIGNGDDATGTVTVINNHGSTLPSTGGMGTTLLYVGGSILVVLAAILLITKRRMNAED